MNKTDSAPSRRPSVPSREARVAEALRENLRKRKAQTRALGAELSLTSNKE